MYTYEKKDNVGEVKITVDAKSWEDALARAYEKNKGKYKVQGFRNGKAPRRVIEQTYGDTVFFDDAFEDVISAEYGNFLKENRKVRPAEAPHVKMDSFTADKGIEATLTFDLIPEVKLGKISGLKAKRTVLPVNEDEVDKQIERLREAHARYTASEEKAKLGDFVTIDFEGSVDGVKFEGGKAENYRLELGSHSFIDTFEEQIVGMGVGDSREIKVKFPENYHVDTLKGKDAVFAVKVNKIEVKVLPDISDKFIADVTEFETLEEYKKDVLEKLKEDAERRADRVYEDALIDEIVDGSVLEVPQSMVDHEVLHMVEDFEHRLSHQGMTLDDYFGYTGTNLTEFKLQRGEEAKKNIKTRLVLQQILEENNITVGKKQIDERIALYAKQYGMSEEELAKSLTPDDIAYFENEILMNKLLDFIKDQNK